MILKTLLVQPTETMAPILDLTGKHFGKLRVLRQDGMLNKRAAWLCACECGTEKTIASTSLVTGASKSCGCAHTDANRKRLFKNLAGQRFGRLTANTPVFGERRVKWSCLCECGENTLVLTSKLTAGITSSCGCARIDKPSLGSVNSRLSGAAHSSARRSRARGAGGKFTAEQITDLYLKQRGCCANCRTKLGDKFHRDHKVALSDGGTNDILNMELLCKPCNLHKHNKDPIHWANQNGRLC